MTLYTVRILFSDVTSISLSHYIVKHVFFPLRRSFDRHIGAHSSMSPTSKGHPCKMTSSPPPPVCCHCTSGMCSCVPAYIEFKCSILSATSLFCLFRAVQIPRAFPREAGTHTSERQTLKNKIKQMKAQRFHSLF